MFPETGIRTLKLFCLHAFKATTYRFQYEHSEEDYEYLTPHFIFSGF
jgi:hypothetical protein